MAKDIKELIDNVEIKNETHNELERTNEFLQEEVKRLTFTIKEQKILISELHEKLADVGDVDIPGDVQLLKEMIMSQRQDLIKRDKDIAILQKQIDEITFGAPEGKKSTKSKKNKDLIEAKKKIVQLTEENEILLVNDSSAKKVLKKLADQNERLTEQVYTQEKQLQSCVSQIQRLESRAPNQEREDLLLEVESFQTQMLDLRQELEKKNKEAQDYEQILKNLQTKAMLDGIKSEIPKISSKIESKEIERANSEIEELSSKNQAHRTTITSLEQEIEELKATHKKMEETYVSTEYIEELRVKNDTYHAKIISLEQELEVLNAIKEKFEESIASPTESADVEDIQQLQEDCRVANKKLETANITINNLIEEIEGYVKEVSENGDEIRKKNTKISVLNTKIESLNQSIEELKAHVEPERPEAELDEWYEKKTAETITNLKEEIERLNGIITELKSVAEPPMVLDEIPDHESAKLGGSSAMPRSQLQEEYDLLIEESQGLIEENERLTEVILELRMAERNKEKKAISVAMGVPIEDNSAEIIESLKDENQKLLDKVLDLNLKIQELQAESQPQEGPDLVEIFKLQAEETIDNLQQENQQLNDLVLELKATNAEAPTEEFETFKLEAEGKIEALLLENLQLNESIENLKEKTAELPETQKPAKPFSPDTNQFFSHYPPKSYQVNLFIYLINLLDDNLREQMIDTLITHLESSNIDVKRFAIDVLSEIRTEKTFNAIKKLVNDQNWVIRLCLVKALAKYNNARILEPLDELLNDDDMDIRRAADKVLKLATAMPSGDYFRDDLTPNRWNWCEEKSQWVFVEEDNDGRRSYKFQLEPPEEFIELNMKLKEINDKMIATTDVEENQKLFEELMKISARLQEMRKGQ